MTTRLLGSSSYIVHISTDPGVTFFTLKVSNSPA